MSSIEHKSEERSAVRNNLGAIFVSLELSRSTWLVTSLSPGSGEKMSKHQVRSGDIAGLLARFSQLQAKSKARDGAVCTVWSRSMRLAWTGSGLIAPLRTQASRATSWIRLRSPPRAVGGASRRTGSTVRPESGPCWPTSAASRGSCAMAKAPTPEREDRRQIGRERRSLTAERVKHVNRIKGLLFARGVTDDGAGSAGSAPTAGDAQNW